MMRIIIADDHKIVRDGLRSLLENEPGVKVIAEASDGRTAVKFARELEPDTVIMDVAMPDMNGIESTRNVLLDNPSIKVIALSMHSDRRFIEEMFKAGASGYLLKDCAFEELVNAINVVGANQFYLSPLIAGLVINNYLRKEKSSTSSAFSVLTSREREVLQLLAEGKTTNQIASGLNISEKTVESHRRQIMKKLDLYSVAELTKYAIREGLTSI